MTQYRTILILGPPGSGKGTQGKTLGMLPGFFHCSCGDVFRAIDLKTEPGAAFLSYSRKGQLVPDEITIQLWQAHIRSCIATRAFKPNFDRLLLDGIPRNLGQARLLESVIAIERIFYLAGVSDDTITSRLRKRALKENRLDDASDEVVRRRLEVYQNETVALLNHYPVSLITQIDATQQPHAVLSEILIALVAQERVPIST